MKDVARVAFPHIRPKITHYTIQNLIKFTQTHEILALNDPKKILLMIKDVPHDFFAKYSIQETSIFYNWAKIMD